MRTWAQVDWKKAIFSWSFEKSIGYVCKVKVVSPDSQFLRGQSTRAKTLFERIENPKKDVLIISLSLTEQMKQLCGRTKTVQNVLISRLLINRPRS